MKKLTFGKGNAKLSKDIHTFSLPAGFTCPGAHLCAAFAHPETGKIRDGKDAKFRCFAASQESLYPNVRTARWHNWNLLKPIKNDAKAMADLILASIDRRAKIVRIHVSGDYFNDLYMLAWIKVAESMPGTRFYSYTKSIHYIKDMGKLPDNFILTLSEGGKFDDLIPDLAIKTAKVVFSQEQADALSLDIDHDDSHAYDGTESFALLIHGTQKAASEASKAIKKLKAGNVKYSYSKR